MITLIYDNDDTTNIAYTFHDSDIGRILKHFAYFLRALSHPVDVLCQASADDNIISPEEYREVINDERAQAISEYIESRAGWIPWSGDDERCPVHGDIRVCVRFRCGDEQGPDQAHYWDWRDTDDPGDIVAYRVIEPTTPEGERSECYTEDDIRVAFASVGTPLSSGWLSTSDSVITRLQRMRSEA